MKKEVPKFRDDPPLQMAIDPETGKDITGQVIGQRLKELEAESNALLAAALAEYSSNPSEQQQIYEKYYWEIHTRLGQGSIGPATAAAGPLMYSQMNKLGDLLKIDEKNRI